MKIIGQSIADEADIAKALIGSKIPFTWTPRTFNDTSTNRFDVYEGFEHRAHRAVDEVLAKSRYYFAP